MKVPRFAMVPFALAVAAVLAGWTPSPALAAPVPASGPVLERKVVVYYFYNKIRCVSCRNIEAYTGEALGDFFAPQLKSGEIEWRPVNLDEKGNAHYAEDYKLFSKSVVVSRVVDGKEKGWTNLSRVWELLGDKEGFKRYIRTELQKALEGKGTAP